MLAGFEQQASSVLPFLVTLVSPLFTLPLALLCSILFRNLMLLSALQLIVVTCRLVFSIILYCCLMT